MKVLKVGAEWCNGCLVMRPRFAEIEKENPWLKTEYFDFDKNKEIVSKYKIEQGLLPVFIFLDNTGEEIMRLNGEVDKDKIVKTINELRDK